MMRCLVVAVSVAVAGALSTQSVSRARFLRSAEAAALTWASSRVAWADDYETLDSGLRYKVLKKGDGAVPKVGDLICIRFKGSFEGRVFDDITETPEPLYYRVGSGTLIKGIDEALPLMRFGDTWSLVIPGPLGFGPKGRPASAGKPRIPSNAELVYELSIVGFPGFEGDLIDTVL